MRNAFAAGSPPRPRRWLLVSAALAGVVLGLGALLATSPAGARAPLAKYAGIHPLNPHMGAFCYINVPHLHAEWPPDIRVYRTLSSQAQAFIGDPVALGYDGPKVAYFGPHPLVSRDLPASESVYCYLRGAHHHAQPPEPATSFVPKDNVYWFTGTFPPEFARDYARNDWINEVRGLGTYTPPKVDIASAPPGYHLPAVFDKPAMVPVVPAPPDATAPGKAPSKKVVRKVSPGAPAPKPAAAPPVGVTP